MLWNWVDMFCSLTGNIERKGERQLSLCHKLLAATRGEKWSNGNGNGNEAWRRLEG
jgi:hypothetical protein